MHIYLLNGPPGCGKDTLANELQSIIPYSKNIKFSSPLKKAVQGLYLGGSETLMKELDQPGRKDEPTELCLGRSLRQVQISLSEDYMKPQYGQSVFGHLLATNIREEIKRGINTFFVSDSGFVAEAEVICNEFGPENVTIIRIHRQGKTFNNDSRGYITIDKYKVKEIDVTNQEGDYWSLVNRVLEEIP